ncbi:MAG: DUF1269 domain-containing protein [Cyanobacteria bacterium P01_H01_bin.152]
MASDKTYFAYIAVYDNAEHAKGDLDAFREIAAAGVVGRYDTALLTKDDDGKVHIKKRGTPPKSGAWRGALAGTIISLLFPPSIIAGGILGGAAGALVGKLWGGMSRQDLKELGELLDESATGLVIFGESKLDEFIEKALKRATKQIAKEIRAMDKEFEKYLTELEKEAEKESE